MPAQVSANPSLSRSRYPPPLYFDSNGTHLRSPASPNKVDKDRHSLLPAGNTRYEDRPADATARPTDMFDRNNSNNSSTTYSSDAYSTAPSQPEQQRALSPPRRTVHHSFQPDHPSQGPSPFGNPQLGLSSRLQLSEPFLNRQAFNIESEAGSGA